MNQSLLKFAPVMMLVGGLMMASPNGCDITPGPSPFPVAGDTLGQSHVNDRKSQVRILREYLDRNFSNDSEAQKWLNDERIAARPDDWAPYTDELGAACAEGTEAVKKLADALEARL